MINLQSMHNALRTQRFGEEVCQHLSGGDVTNLQSAFLNLLSDVMKTTVYMLGLRLDAFIDGAGDGGGVINTERGW